MKISDLNNAKERKSEFNIFSSPALNTNYYGFNCQSPTFSKKEVRLAFNHAIDRQKIADYTIQGEGEAAFYGIVYFRAHKYHPFVFNKFIIVHIAIK